jgi:trafficking protein particle complex subunit 8
LGDIKLAVSVWEVLRKEGKGGSEILPLLLAPGPGVPLHAQYALSQGAPQDGEQHPRAALRAITFAVRWVVGIDSQEFMGNVLEGDRWLVWAAANVR